MGVWYARGYSIGPKGLGVSKWTERLSCWWCIQYSSPISSLFGATAAAIEGANGTYGKISNDKLGFSLE